ncbi:MAG: hypothetical protein A3G95_08915 [Flavobacteria bacterium RIFCSPLOWO2_12_FULL_31_7]|nr:MAG: hypothetical protein A3G95_08915 [Flavobacteria bacterium RIFCSPLOWO2_12_FULL_31_7]
MKNYFFTIILLITFYNSSYSQEKIKIENIELCQKDKEYIVLKFPITTLDTGKIEIKKRIAVYENYILEKIDMNGNKNIISKPIYAIEGFCNSKKKEFKKEFSINSKEYFLEVTYIYADGSKKTVYKTLKI